MEAITILAGSQTGKDRIRIRGFLLQQKLLKKYKQKIYESKMTVTSGGIKCVQTGNPLFPAFSQIKPYPLSGLYFPELSKNKYWATLAFLSKGNA